MFADVFLSDSNVIIEGIAPQGHMLIEIAPTSSGKTTILVLAILRMLHTYKQAKVFCVTPYQYVVPHKSNSVEHFVRKSNVCLNEEKTNPSEKWKRQFRHLGFTCKTF